MSTHVGHAHDRATAAARSRSVLALTLVLTFAFLLVDHYLTPTAFQPGGLIFQKVG